MSEAATPTGGAEGSARPQTAPTRSASPQTSQSQNAPKTIQERVKASLFAQAEPAADEGRAVTQPRTTTGEFAKGEEVSATHEAPIEEPDAQGVDEAGTGENPDTTEVEQSIKSLNELAEGLGWDLDRVLDLEAPTKINGKEGKVALRDILKSHQLEGHLNQGLMKLAEERKAFEGENLRKTTEFQSRVTQLNQAVGLAQKILDGEFADVNWQELQRTDPAAFQAQYGAYTMRQDGIRQLNSQVMQEQEREKATQKAAQEAYLAEQAKLLDTKVPEWADKGKREKDVAEMVATLGDAYGLTEQEIRSSPDHRLILIARDAMRWQKLQKSKPATLNKVRAAPKLIRPGTQQSRSAQEGLAVQKDRDRLRSSGRPQDAAKVLRHLIFKPN